MNGFCTLAFALVVRELPLVVLPHPEAFVRPRVQRARPSSRGRSATSSSLLTLQRDAAYISQASLCHAAIPYPELLRRLSPVGYRLWLPACQSLGFSQTALISSINKFA